MSWLIIKNGEKEWIIWVSRDDKRGIPKIQTREKTKYKTLKNKEQAKQESEKCMVNW